ncbi:hypothetical protein [Actinoplanes sp. G11-F43]|uniref:hypothetical protein n=1 Tax=Actinoplanes sp. G11-F43 TaxID=3424130 RepID=UPI003D359624
MADNLTPQESAILIILMCEAREVSNPELNERHGITLTGQSRTKLNTLGYIRTVKAGRSFVHVLDERGWVRVHEDLNFNGGGKAIGAALSTLHRILRERVLVKDSYRSFGEMFTLAAGAPSAPDDDLETRVRQVYHSLAPEPGGWVKHTAVRQKLGDVPGEALDEVFRLLGQAEDVEMMPEANQKTLTAEDRRDAVRVGGQDTHLISIGTR